ncbi:MAG: hypothetical protein K2N51_00260 [Lachnospiraceae bacterium]|nr:hypothetical protein [Lachnospiraceae bacterium]
MFDKFGEFNSVEELNMAAEGFLKEGDTESLYALAEENGIDKEDAEDYVNGDTEVFATSSMAVYGRIAVQEKEIAKSENQSEKMINMVILNMTKAIMTDSEMQKGIMKKGKRITEIMELMKKGAAEHQSGTTGVSCGTDRELQNIIYAYFVDGNAEEVIKGLYE